jgi:cysteine desulfurase/selenocysteine lyase
MSFNIDGLGAHDVAMMLDSMDGIMVRSGMHCAHPFFVSRGVDGSVRASVYIYNNRSDIDRLASALGKISETFGE